MSDFSLSITHWYRQNKRSLPWRSTTNPYFIWLSEIILQQTRVEQGMAYYLKFVRNYPDVHALANAPEQEVLNDWQGLGYYSRARNLHYSAKLIATQFKGKFPETYEEILQLKGVGTYTAAAIASFAYNEKRAVVDGNVYRLLSRVFDIETPIDIRKGQLLFQELADTLIPEANPGEHNQAMMEMGAVICTPTPNCVACPVDHLCLARERNTISMRPAKSKRTKVRNRYFIYHVYDDGKSIVLEKRTEKDIWQHLYQFPLKEVESRDQLETYSDPNASRNSPMITHVLSHQKIHVVFTHFHSLPSELKANWEKIDREQLQDYPLPRLIDRYLEENSQKSI